MTEPLLLALLAAGGVARHRGRPVGRAGGDSARRPRAGGRVPDALRSLAVRGRVAGARASWPALAAGPSRLRGRSVLAGRLAAYPAAAILAFLLLSRATVGAWFVTGGFFVAENPDAAPAGPCARRPCGGALHGCQVSPRWPRRRGRPGLLLVRGLAVAARWLRWLPARALAGVAALPWYAFYSGAPVPDPLHDSARPRPRAGRRVRGRAGGAHEAACRRGAGPRGTGARDRGPLDPNGPDGRGGAVGPREPGGPGRGDGLPPGALGRPRRSWPAWDRSPTTCRSSRATGSASATSCTRATATSGVPRWSIPTRTPSGCSIEEQAEGGDMLAERARSRHGDTWPATRASLRAAASRSTEGVVRGQQSVPEQTQRHSAAVHLASGCVGSLATGYFARTGTRTSRGC